MSWWENLPTADAPSGNDRVSQFVSTYRPMAEKIGQEIGVSPDIILAKFGNETGWGRSVIPGTNNLGNIKDPSGRGVYATDNMTGSRDAYRRFESPDEFGAYYTDFIKRLYPKAVGAGNDPAAFAAGLKQGVRGSYAEDPAYAQKIAKATSMVTKGNQPAAANAWWESLPSADAPETAPAAAQGGNWWESLPAADAPEAAPAPVAKTAPAVTKEAPKAAPKRTAAESFGLGTRNVAEGLEGALTYPVKAAGEFVSGLTGIAGAGLEKLGYKDLAQKAYSARQAISKTVGMQNAGVASSVADAAGLAKPETETEKTIAAGTKAAAGLVTGTALNKAAEKAPELVKGALSVLMPGTSGTAREVAKDVGIYGGLGAAMEAAPAETAAGLAVLAAGKVGADKVLTNRAATKMIEKAGSTEAARVNAEVARDFAKVASNPNLRALDDAGLPTIATAMRNQQAGRYIDDVTEAIKRVEPGLLKKYDVATLLKPDRIVGPDELALIRAEGKSGEILADAIGKYQRAIALTAPTPASGSVGAKLARAGIEWAPVAAGTALGGPMGTLATIMAPKLLSGTAQRLTGKKTVPEVIERLASGRSLKAAEEVLRRLGPSEAALGTQRLADAARKAETAQAAAKALAAEQKAARIAAKSSGGAVAKKAADPQTAIADLQAKDPTYLLGLSNPNGVPRNADQMSEFSKVLRAQMEARAAREAAGAEKSKLIAQLQKGPQVDPKIAALRDQREPLGGAFQYLIKPDSGLGLKPNEVIQGLRILGKRPDTPSGSAADIIRRSAGDGTVDDTFAFNALQTRLRQLRDAGVLGNRTGGALSEATAASPVRNPISYAETVRTAGAAADLARANAPSKELAQFATRVAGIKSPEAKAKAIADRLSKTSDPAEQAFLTQFVEPLAQFGKKAK